MVEHPEDEDRDAADDEARGFQTELAFRKAELSRGRDMLLVEIANAISTLLSDRVASKELDEAAINFLKACKDARDVGEW